MKRGTSEMKRTEMKRGASTLGRTEMKRGTTRIKPRSTKQDAAYAGTDEVEGRRAYVARKLEEAPVCEAQRVWATLHDSGATVVLSRAQVEQRAFACDYYAVDVHELLARSAGGGIVDEANTTNLCRACHDWIGRKPLQALALGLRQSRYAGRNPADTILKPAHGDDQ